MSLPVIISIAFYLAFIFYLFYAMYILSYEKKTTIHKIYCCCCFSLAIWAFSFSIANSAADYDTCLFWRKVASVGWGTFFSMVLHFSLVLTQKTDLLSKKWIYVGLYLPAFFNVFVFGLYREIADQSYQLVYCDSGWVNISQLSFLDLYFNAYYIVFAFTSIYCIFYQGNKFKDQLKKREAYLIGMAYFIVVSIGVMTEFVINAIFDVRVPQIAPLIILFPISVMFLYTKQYGVHFTEHTQKIVNIGSILSEDTRFQLYRYLSVGYLFAGVLNFAALYFGKRDSIESAMIVSSIFITLGILLYIIQKLGLKLRYKDICSDLIMSATIPLVVLEYSEYTMYALIVPIVFLFVAIAFNQKRMEFLTGMITVSTLVYLWWKQPNQIFAMNSMDHLIRLLIFIMLLCFSLYINHIYLMRLRDNEEQIKMKNFLSQISNLFLMAEENNLDKKMTHMLNLCSRHFQADRIYVIIFAEEENNKVFEWSNHGIDPLKNTLERLKLKDLPECLRVNLLKQTKSICVADVALMEDGCLKDWLERRQIQSFMLNTLMNKNQVIGYVGLETIQEVSVIQKNQKEIVNLLAYMISNVWIKIESEKENNYRANFDALTGLVNRGNLVRRVGEEIEIAKSKNKKVGIIFIDVDSFKTVNDTLGHNGGDALLIQISQRLKRYIRYNDMVARFGGDEFLILVSDITNVDDLKKISKKILNGFKRPIVINNQSFFVTVSLGLSLYPVDGDQAEELIRYADMAMYHSKMNGKNKYTICSDEMRKQALLQTELTNDLQYALERNEFILHYQPQVSGTTGKIIGVEALIRWQHPHKGLISPGIFIPLVERTGLINKIGEWVLNEACCQNKTWEAQGFANINMAVNLSLAQFLNPNLVNTVRLILTKTKLNPSLLELEITESIATYDKDNILRTMNKLKELGVSLSIDDFGTEYSSLSRLEQMPIDKIKIDMKFVHGIATGSKDEGIIKVILQMGQSFGLKVIAEGVETQQQFNFLKENACDEIQGYYFYKPMIAKEITKILKSRG